MTHRICGTEFLSAGEYAKEARRLRRQGLTKTHEYKQLIEEWADMEADGALDEVRTGHVALKACLSCWTRVCRTCHRCHECEDPDLHPEIINLDHGKVKHGQV